MPELTARSFAEMMHMPAYEQQRILYEQKYPRQTPNVFRLPFYKPALDTIKLYYRNGNNPGIINTWMNATAQTLNPQARRTNNIRVTSSFLSSNQANRMIQITRSMTRYLATTQGVDLKLTFDIYGNENSVDIYLLYNCRNVPIDSTIARDTLQISYWIMLQNGFQGRIQQLQYVDLVGNAVYTARQLTNTLQRNMNNNASIVSAIWNTI